MKKIVNAAFKAKAWTFEAKAKTIKLGLKVKVLPRGPRHWHSCNVLHSPSTAHVEK